MAHSRLENRIYIGKTSQFTNFTHVQCSSTFLEDAVQTPVRLKLFLFLFFLGGGVFLCKVLCLSELYHCQLNGHLFNNL